MSLEQVIVPQPKPINYDAGKPTCAYCGFAGSANRPLHVFVEVRLKLHDQCGVDLHQNCMLPYQMIHCDSMFQYAVKGRNV